MNEMNVLHNTYVQTVCLCCNFVYIHAQFYALCKHAAMFYAATMLCSSSGLTILNAVTMFNAAVFFSWLHLKANYVNMSHKGGPNPKAPPQPTNVALFSPFLEDAPLLKILFTPKK